MRGKLAGWRASPAFIGLCAPSPETTQNRWQALRRQRSHVRIMPGASAKDGAIRAVGGNVPLTRSRSSPCLTARRTSSSAWSASVHHVFSKTAVTAASYARLQTRDGGLGRELGGAGRRTRRYVGRANVPVCVRPADVHAVSAATRTSCLPSQTHGERKPSPVRAEKRRAEPATPGGTGRLAGPSVRECPLRRVSCPGAALGG
jgi:hypothetical protein